MSESAIRIENISKLYKLGAKTSSKKGGVFSNMFASKKDDMEGKFWALKDLSFNVQKGQLVAVIGKNGAGKSTLLKILSRITQPTSGRIEINGRIASLLEVGTGFHPELTGRENIFLNGMVLGMRKSEIKAKFDEIVEFSGVEKFLDTPVKHYSSGMYVRLAFSVAAHLEPEILIIDEVLAVGDVSFQRKCIGKMSSVVNEGRTVMIVSHQMDVIKSLCNYGVFLKEGTKFMEGPIDDVVNAYMLQNAAEANSSGSISFLQDKDIPIQIKKISVVGANGKPETMYDSFDDIYIELEYVVRKKVEGSIIALEIKRNGLTLHISFDSDHDTAMLKERQPGHHKARIKLPVGFYKDGIYTITVQTGIVKVTPFERLEDVLKFEVMLQSRQTSFLSYSKDRPGLVIMPIQWKTEKLIEKI